MSQKKYPELKMYSKLTKSEIYKLKRIAKPLLLDMYERKCYYCGIEEKEFTDVWKKPIYKRGTRTRLEIEHKDGNLNGHLNWELENLVLACPICNIAKSDQLSEEEFRKIGKVIRKIWQQRKSQWCEMEESRRLKR